MPLFLVCFTILTEIVQHTFSGICGAKKVDNDLKELEAINKIFHLMYDDLVKSKSHLNN